MTHSITTPALAAAVTSALVLASSSASAQSLPQLTEPVPAHPYAGDAPVVEGAQVHVHVEPASCAPRCQPAPGPPPPPANWAPRHARSGSSESHYLSRLDYVEGLPPPDGYVEATQIRRGLVIAGSIVTAVPWVASFSAAIGVEGGRGAALAIPVLGPWLAMPSLGSDGGARAALTLSGLTQAAGATMLLIGLAHPKRSFVKYTSADLEISAMPLPGGVSLAATY